MQHSADTTPIIPGFYPDPSICRVGDTYYLANSSFEFFPGVPVFASDDLVTWTQVGNAFDRESQLPASSGAPSSGIFAPTLRHHLGRFWLVTTIVGDAPPEQVILHSATAEGPWSDPVTTNGARGIDPDLAWDGDDCFLTWTTFDGPTPGIVQARIDPTTAELLEQPRPLWAGTGMAAPEGPHLYRRGDWWYLLLAEGGTERGHSVTVARSRRPDAGFEGNPANPILTRRSTTHPVQNTGHADLVENADGSWAVVFLGVRPRGTTPGFHVNGRETFIAGIEWVDDWPIVTPFPRAVPGFDTAFVDDFSASQLAHRWIAPGATAARFATPGADGGLELRAGDDGAVRMLAVRARDEQWTAVVDLDTAAGTGRVIVRTDATHWCGIEVDDTEIRAVQVIGATRTVLARRDSTGSATRVVLSAVNGERAALLRLNGPDELELGIDGEVLARIDGRYFSTEVAGGFTGRVIAVEVESGLLGLRRVDYSPLG